MRGLAILIGAAAVCFVVMAMMLGTSSEPAAESTALPGVSPTEGLGPEPQSPAVNWARSGEGMVLAGDLAGTDLDKNAPRPDYLRRRKEYARLFAQGDYDASAAAIEAMLGEFPSDLGLRMDLATALFAMGVRALQASEVERAAEALRRSLDLGNERASAPYARALLLQGQRTEARRILESEYTARPDRSVLEALIDLSLAEGNNSAASQWLAEYEKAVAHRQEQDLGQDNNKQAEAAQTFLNARRRRVAAGQKLDESGYVLSRDDVQVRYVNLAAERLAERVLQKVHASLEGFRGRFGAAPPNAKFDLELFEEAQFSDATGAPPWAGAIFDGIMRVPFPPAALTATGDTTRVERIAVHETSHAYLYSLCGDGIPSWLGEGLAQMAEGRSAAAARQGLAQSLGPQWASRAPYRELEQPFVGVSDAVKVRNLYLTSLVLTGALERRWGAGVWRRLFVLSCAGSTSLPEAMEGELGSRTAALLWEQNVGRAP